MSSPVVAVEASERLFLALLAMVSRNIHHVLVTQQGNPTGVLTAHDLMVLQGKSPLNVVRFIDAQTNVQDLAKANHRISGLLPLLLREGAKASHVTRVVAEMNDRLIVKILQFAEAKLGPPPVPYCWVVLGSEGRREQTFKTDQDNALIYADSEDQSSAREYFAQLAVFAQDALSTCGYPLCPGNYMASNPRWRQPLSAWMTYFHEWIDPSRTSRHRGRSHLPRHASGGGRLLSLPDARRQESRMAERRRHVQVCAGLYLDHPQASAGILPQFCFGEKRRAQRSA